MEEIFETPDDVLEVEDVPSSLSYRDSSSRSGGGGGGAGDKDGQVVKDSLKPARAFEVFAGKTYTTGPADMSDNLNASSGVHRSHEIEYVLGGVEGSNSAGIGGTAAVLESPMERLMRLKAESAQLEEDLKQLASKAAQENAQDSDGVRPNELWATMSSEASELQMQLASVASDPLYLPLLTPLAPREDVALLQAKLTAQLSVDHSHMEKGGGDDTADHSKRGNKKREGEGDSGGAIRLGSGLSLVEARLAQLESVVGSASEPLDLEGSSGASKGLLGIDGVVNKAGGVGVGVGGGGQGLLQIVNQLQWKLQLADGRRLSTLQHKAALARAELEALRKAKAKDGGAAVANSEYARKVDEVYSTIQQWESTAADLPLLIERLATLATVHQESAQFSQRLTLVEAMQEKLDILLKEATRGVEAMENSLQANLEVTQENLQSLDERMKQLSQSLLT